ncbi:MAG: flagellar hook-associated protein FlgK [Phycisphaerae bacterium]|nr:flagellar hook-associated protein FlgK [Phycisphaerae bacterium]NIP52895.1 flagellar hook-associated protein FlgK [Phycisphaerae bacterium]NIS51946.1 flagellar hook-associated protein FlgK [Phycisphaerae bacterium]NIU09460.1 flagellar hook-associated protein FlgK [Phycisphaerae bacterium]NIU57193.1 flagellar hook-associated protein FlgK [Phycisphaerae bacterium]
MDSYSIGLSGLDAAQKALETIGNNIANAATEGYHRQRINLVPRYTSQSGSVILGGGVDVAGITRMIDNFLEQEILRQQSSLGQVSQEFSTLRTVETAFGELSSGTGLNAVIDEFFNALHDLSAHPTEIIWQTQVVTAAQTMANQFRTLGKFLNTLEDQLRLEAENTIEQINTLINRIADLNDNIERIEISGGQANNLRDQRDQCITELSELINVDTQIKEYGVVNVSAAGIPVVTNAIRTELELGLTADGKLGISVAGLDNYNTNVQSGRLGGLLSLSNEIIFGIHTNLDTLASTIIQQINQYHMQGVGSEGSFSQLTGWTNTSGDLTDFSSLSAGYMYIRVTDTGSGAVTRTAVPVLQDASSDTLAEIAGYITSNVANVTATVNSSNQLTITADAGYEFDFLPSVLPDPTAGTLTGTSPPAISVSGIYTGTLNDTLRFAVSGAGSVGNGTLQLEVRDGGGAGDVIATLNIGSGYAAGDLLDLGNGIKISLGTGDFGAGDSFDVDVFADSDTSSLLGAMGINTFFSGNSAIDMAVCSDISDEPGRVATFLGADMTDNTIITRMAALKDEAISELNNMTPVEFYRRLVTDVGQQLFLTQMREDNVEVIMQNLANQQAEISGVNINDEAAQMLVYEQMFQAMAKYLNTVQSSISSLMEII